MPSKAATLPELPSLRPRPRLLCIGLTGGIASGKSTLAALIVEQTGAGLVDADAISRALTAAGGAALAPIAHTFGAEVLDPVQGLNRSAMRERIFSNAQAKAQLEGILHPMIQAECWRQVAAYEQQAATVPFVLIDVPLLFESRSVWRPLLDKVVLVDCSVESQVSRLMARSKLEREMAQRIIASQATREERRSIADTVVYNDGPAAAYLPQQCLQVVDGIIKMECAFA